MAMIVRIKDRYFQLLCLAGDVMNILNMAAALHSLTKVSTLGPTLSQPSLQFSFFQSVSNFAQTLTLLSNSKSIVIGNT